MSNIISLVMKNHKTYEKLKLVTIKQNERKHPKFYHENQNKMKEIISEGKPKHQFRTKTRW